MDRRDHVHWDADGAGLIGDGTGDSLANPPRTVSRELVATAPLELVDTPHQADVALLDQVEELQAAVVILLRDGNDEAEVRFDQFFLRLFSFDFATNDNLQRALQFCGTDFGGDFNFAQLGAAVFQIASRFGENVAFRSVYAALELDDFALEGVNALDGLTKFVDQPLAFE